MKCEFCEADVFCDAIEPAMCLKHYEAALLISRLTRQGLPVTLSVVQRKYARSLESLALEPEEVQAYVEDVLGKAIEIGELPDPVEIFTGQGGFFWSDSTKRAGFRAERGCRVFQSIFPDWEVFVV